MKSSSNEQTPRAHYRDRHISLYELPPESTEHGFRGRLNKTSNEDLRRQAYQRPVTGVFRLDGSDPGQEPDEFAPMGPNNQVKKPRGRPRAATASRAPPSTQSLPLQVKIGPPVPTNRRTNAAAPVPYPGTQYGPVSPSYNSDDTPVSATDPHQAHFQGPYQMAAGDEFGRHFVGGGAQTMGFLGSPSQNGFAATFDPQYQVSLTGDNPYGIGLMPLPYSSPDGPSILDHNVYYTEEGVKECSSGAFYYDANAQLGQPSGHIVPTASYAGSTSYSHGNGQYPFYPTNFSQ